VGVSANSIEIDNRGNSDYYGPLYIGDDYKENHMVYDTMADWTIVVGDGAKGVSSPGNYDETESTTAKGITFKYKNVTSPATETVNLGSVAFTGEKYKE